MQINKYLEEIWKVLSIGNKAIEIHQPWTKIKEGKNDEANALVALIANILAKVSILLSSVMPQKIAQISACLSLEISYDSYKSLILEAGMLGDFEIKKIEPLFPRIEEPLLASTEQTQEESKKIEEKKSKKKKT